MPYELNINTQYLRTTPPSTTPGPIGGENNPEEGKCNNFRERYNEGSGRTGENPTKEPSHIVIQYTVIDKESSLKNFLERGISANYLVDKEGEIYHLVDHKYASYSLKWGKLTGLLKPKDFKGDTLDENLSSWVITIQCENDMKIL